MPEFSLQALLFTKVLYPKHLQIILHSVFRARKHSKRQREGHIKPSAVSLNWLYIILHAGGVRGRSPGVKREARNPWEAAPAKVPAPLRGAGCGVTEPGVGPLRRPLPATPPLPHP